MRALLNNELPHTGAMRWVHEAEAAADGSATLAHVAIDPSHPFVRDGKLLPSALIEVMAQGAAGGFAIKARAKGQRIKHGLLVGIRGLEVLVPVVVRDVVEVRGIQEKQWGALWQFSMEARVGTALVARGSMTFHLRFE